MSEQKRIELEMERKQIDSKVEDLVCQRLKLEEELKSIQKKLAEPTFWPKRYDFYLHSSEEGNCERMQEDLEDAGIWISEDDDFWRQLCYACYEVEINCLIERDGSIKLIGMNGTKLSEEAVTPAEL